MNTLLMSKTITISIARDPKAVYDFISNPENFPKWAKTFCLSISRKERKWVIETKQGPMELKITEKNEFRIVDHSVRPEKGHEIYVPMRVVANGTGSEVIFTVFQQTDMSHDSFAKDISLVEQDLQSLKETLTL